MQLNDLLTLLVQAYEENNAEKIKKFIYDEDCEFFYTPKNENALNKPLKDGKTLLHLACEKGASDIVKILVDHPQINLYIPDDTDGYTALHMACIKGHSNVVSLLLPFYSTLNAPDNYSATALDYAVREGYFNIVEVLLKRQDIELNKRLFGKGTSLFLACSNKKSDIVKLLLKDERIDANWQKPGTMITALHIACRKGIYQSDIVQSLLSSDKCELTKEDSSGNTYFDYLSVKQKIEVSSFYLHLKGIELSSLTAKSPLDVCQKIAAFMGAKQFSSSDNGYDDDENAVIPEDVIKEIQAKLNQLVVNEPRSPIFSSQSY